MKTYYAPAERTDPAHVRAQVESIAGSHAMETLLQGAFGLLLVINDNRQIVAINRTFTDTLGIADPEKALGLRIGELLHCKFAFAEPHGCGTTPYCPSCGAVIAMMAAIDGNQPCERICALSTERKGHAHDICLRVCAQPVTVDGTRWILVHAQDIGHMQNCVNLENEFLHDLDNMLCLVKNYSAYLFDQAPADKKLHTLRVTTERAHREIRLRNRLKHHRYVDSLAAIERTSLETIRKMVFTIVLNRNTMTGKNIAEEGTTGDIWIATDPVLAARVIINMLLNALEATESGGTVILRTIPAETSLTWQAWNRKYIPANIQLRIFQKYFSTSPEIGRGQGTYVMKLLGEEYLGGTVAFVSTAEEGTTFSFTLPLG